MKISDFRAYEREVGTAELGALHGCKAHPSEAIANLAMSPRGFQLRWGVLENPRAKAKGRFEREIGISSWLFNMDVFDRTSSPPWSTLY